MLYIFKYIFRYLFMSPKFKIPAYLPFLAAGLAFLYMNTGGNPSGKTNVQKYALPKEINILETTLPYATTTNLEGVVENKIKTADIDFSKHFYIRTDRYTLSRNQDWLPSRIIGHISCLPGKLLFWDWNVGWGPDNERSRAALSMLENNKEIKDLTVRINHNEFFKDTYRMFTEKKLTERNGFIPRATFGILTSAMGSLMAELGRGDYYNPITSTVVNYSNIESFLAHELGHHKDYKRFDRDWIYSLTRPFPPVMLYQEGAASYYAKEGIVSKDDGNQIYRYLLPAFITYLIGAVRTTRKIKNLIKKSM